MNFPIELTAFRGQVAWELPAALFLVMAQAGAFALLAGSLRQAFGRAPSDLSACATLAGAALAVCAPLCLVAEMLAPWRFATLVWRFTPSSPLSWGVAALTLQALAGLIRAVGLWRPGPLSTRSGAWLTGLVALGVLAYTTAEVLLASGVPLWRHPAALASGLCAGLCVGLVATLAAARLCGRPTWRPLARALASLSGAVAGLTLLAWGFLGQWPQAPGWWQGTALLAGSGVVLFCGGVLLARSGEKGFALAGACVLLGAVGARLGVLLAGQAESLGRDLGEPHLLGHLPLLTATAPAFLAAAGLCLAGLALTRRGFPRQLPAPSGASASGTRPAWLAGRRGKPTPATRQEAPAGFTDPEGASAWPKATCPSDPFVAAAQVEGVDQPGTLLSGDGPAWPRATCPTDPFGLAVAADPRSQDRSASARGEDSPEPARARSGSVTPKGERS